MRAVEMAKFGELDPEQEDDFGSVLQPRKVAERPKEQVAPVAAHKVGRAGTKKAAQTAEKPSVAAIETAAGGVAPKAPAVAPKPRRGRPAGQRSSTSQAAGAMLVLWTPESIRARMQAVRASTGKLYLDQVLDALEATVDDLPELVAKTAAPRTTRGSLFERTQVSTVVADTYRKQLTIRGVLQSQLDVIDALVDSTGAGSRSRLINIALDEVLPNR